MTDKDMIRGFDGTLRGSLGKAKAKAPVLSAWRKNEAAFSGTRRGTPTYRELLGIRAALKQIATRVGIDDIEGTDSESSKEPARVAPRNDAAEFARLVNATALAAKAGRWLSHKVASMLIPPPGFGGKSAHTWQMKSSRSV